MGVVQAGQCASGFAVSPMAEEGGTIQNPLANTLAIALNQRQASTGVVKPNLV
jgi:hypothetical protein